MARIPSKPPSNTNFILGSERTPEPVVGPDGKLRHWKCSHCSWKSDRPDDLSPKSLQSIFKAFDGHSCQAFQKAS
jgi:hypothetical protein